MSKFVIGMYSGHQPMFGICALTSARAERRTTIFLIICWRRSVFRISDLRSFYTFSTVDRSDDREISAPFLAHNLYMYVALCYTLRYLLLLGSRTFYVAAHWLIMLHTSLREDPAIMRHSKIIIKPLQNEQTGFLTTVLFYVLLPSLDYIDSLNGSCQKLTFNIIAYFYQ